jgi:hypothetical protein
VANPASLNCCHMTVHASRIGAQANDDDADGGVEVVVVGIENAAVTVRVVKLLRASRLGFG